MLIRIFIFLQILFVLTSCNNEIDVIDEVDSKPVVYSLLNLNDTVYAVSLTRTFVGTENIYYLARDPHVVFYPSADIRLDGLSGDSIIWSTSFYQSEQIKEDGLFPTEPGHLYYSNSVLPGIDEHGYLTGDFRNIEKLRLSIDIPLSNVNTTAIVPIYRPNFIGNPSSGRKISLYGREDFVVTIAQRKGSSFRQLNFKIRYLEKLKGSNEVEEKELEFIGRTKIPATRDGIEAQIPGDFFLNKLVANIPTVNDLQFRRFIDFDLILYSADEVYKNYTETYVYTTDLAQPAWSNIENGIGIFALMFTLRKEGFTFDQRTIDSIAMSPITKGLKFVRWQ